MDARLSLRAAGLHDGATVAAVVQTPSLAATKTSFALWCSGDSGVATWGKAENGGETWMKLVNLYPICYMYGIFTYIWMIFRVNVGKYSIHGAYGYGLAVA